VASEDTDSTWAQPPDPVRHGVPSSGGPAPARSPARPPDPVRHGVPSSGRPAPARSPAQPPDPVRHGVRSSGRLAPARSPAQPPDPVRHGVRSSVQPAPPRDPAFNVGTGAQSSDPAARAWQRVRASTALPPIPGTSTATSGQSLPDSPAGVELAEAIAVLCHALERAWRNTQQHGMRFEVEPIELILHVGLARTGQGSAGIEWRVRRFDEPVLPQTGAAQTLTIRFAPRLADGGPTLADVDEPVRHREDAAAEPSLSVDEPYDSGM
jgi:Trypsin-co-occurring domain 2